MADDADDADRTPRPPYAEGRDALLDAAARVVARDGFRGLTYRSVAQEAGTTHGLVSYHFGSRDRLIHETAMKARAEAIEGSALEPASDRVEEFADHLAQLAADAPEAQAFQFELALEARRRAELEPEVRALYAEYFAATARALDAVGLADPSPALVRLVFAALDGLMLQQLVFGRPADTEAAVAELQALLRTLAAR
ncbi:TetR/AcrR family transcriptional regulator [Conexibacter woesei]|uniref:Transcriptional regulator, TetR family n=1 Tax=Conexibacter woesei (strain DSM 14684 / CCUG 47730 / CIP 108061 / JCM 11494 / NBRC 100937 / ID131577) TaxID=469383 RepID=D3F2M9_CONWI|nr:TetR family transcriptional regulator [Conexibacter woesei]ADB52295.1 transcriptional regulator, TetR family [Conexibacter woesei DSM 14684]